MLAFFRVVEQGATLLKIPQTLCDLRELETLSFHHNALTTSGHHFRVVEQGATPLLIFVLLLFSFFLIAFMDNFKIAFGFDFCLFG